ncbi:MAG: electron transfer flavoprotein subunit beta/FixA family protein [Polyangiaceae bacterium]|nr:electron transfer flavoprotein subunit beta/FixA family protein [Polyangiaceae bacterium]
MKILVSLKRVADPDHADQIRPSAGGDAIDTTGLEWTLNPFDHYALEAALRLTEDGRAPKQRLGEVVVISLGPADTDVRLRNALAAGADRAIRVETTDEDLDGRLVARVLAAVVAEERPDLVLLGKQAADGDSNQVGQRLGELLDWPVAPFAVAIREDSRGLVVDRLVDGGLLRIRIGLPAVVTVDLAIVGPSAVRSHATDPSHQYQEGVRFASLLAVRQALKKPLVVRPLSALVADLSLGVRRVRATVAPRRQRGRRVESAAELVSCLVEEAKVL